MQGLPAFYLFPLAREGDDIPLDVIKGYFLSLFVFCFSSSSFQFLFLFAIKRNVSSVRFLSSFVFLSVISSSENRCLAFPQHPKSTALARIHPRRRYALSHAGLAIPR